MKRHLGFAIAFALLSISQIATAARQCTEPARTTCINSCISSSCRAACESTYCHEEGSTQPTRVDVPTSSTSPSTDFRYGYQIPLYYGPFLYGYDQTYLNALYQDLSRQRDEVIQFRDAAYQIGDPYLISLANNAYSDIQNQLSELQIYQYPYNLYVTN